MTDFFKADSIERLILLLSSSGVKEFELNNGEKHLKLKFSNALYSENVATSAADTPLPSPVKTRQTESSDTISAPLAGVFYTAPSPDAKPYVTKGAKVNKGDVLCIIEAMKMMNEIESECDGTVRDILVVNASAVEVGQPLFLIDKD